MVYVLLAKVGVTRLALMIPVFIAASFLLSHVHGVHLCFSVSAVFPSKISFSIEISFLLRETTAADPLCNIQLQVRGCILHTRMKETSCSLCLILGGAPYLLISR